MWVERVREGIWHTEPPQRPCHDAVARAEADARRYVPDVLRVIFFEDGAPILVSLAM